MKNIAAYGWLGFSRRMLVLFAILTCVSSPALADTYDDLLEKGVLQYSDGSYDEALVLFDQIARQNPERKEAHLWMGRANEKLKVNAAAVEAYKKYLAVVPKDTEAMVAIARIYKGQGKSEPALLWLQRALDNEQANGKNEKRIATIQAAIALIEGSAGDSAVAAAVPSPKAAEAPPVLEAEIAPQAAATAPTAPKPTITVVKKTAEPYPTMQTEQMTPPAAASPEASASVSVEPQTRPLQAQSKVRWAGLVSMAKPGARLWLHIVAIFVGLWLLRGVAMGMAQYFKLPLTNGELLKVWVITLVTGLVFCAGVWGIHSSKTMAIYAAAVFIMSSVHRMAIAYLSQQHKEAVEKALANTEVRNRLASLLIRNVGQKGGA